MDDPYFDGLGNLLEVMERSEIDELYKAIFNKDNPSKYKTLTARREFVSEKIKGAYRHSLNITSREHEPDWKTICIEACKKIGAELPEGYENLSSHGIEIIYLTKMTDQYFEKNPDKKKEFYNELINEIRKQTTNEVLIDSISKLLENGKSAYKFVLLLASPKNLLKQLLIFCQFLE